MAKVINRYNKEYVSGDSKNSKHKTVFIFMDETVIYDPSFADTNSNNNIIVVNESAVISPTGLTADPISVYRFPNPSGSTNYVLSNGFSSACNEELLCFNPLKVPAGIDTTLWIDMIAEAFYKSYSVNETTKHVFRNICYKIYEYSGYFEQNKDDPKVARARSTLTLKKVFSLVDEIIDDIRYSKKENDPYFSALSEIRTRMQIFFDSNSVEYRCFSKQTSDGIGMGASLDCFLDNELSVFDLHNLEENFKYFISNIILMGSNLIFENQGMYFSTI